MDVRMQRHEITDVVVVCDLTVQIDGDQPADASVDSQDRTSANVRALTELYIRTDASGGVYDSSPRQSQLTEMF
jgi:hypothetical protein